MKEIERPERLNSTVFRPAGTGTDTKIYFSDADDLLKQLNDLRQIWTDVEEDVAYIRHLCEKARLKN